jgi:hypothetical protein
MRTHWFGIPLGLGLAGLGAIACGSSASKTTGASGSTSSSSGAGGHTTSSSSSGAGGLPAGETNCSRVYAAALVDGGMGFVTSLVAGDFPNNPAWMAYEALNACACANNATNGGCMDVCTFAPEGGADLCFGAGADPGCTACLASTCKMQIATCEAN